MTPFGSDTALLEAMHRGDPEAFAVIYNSHRRWLLVAAISILHNEQEAEELVQEFFIDLWQKKLLQVAHIPTPEALKNFLFVSLKNRCLNRLAKNDTRRRLMNRLLLSESITLPNRRIENEELKAQLDAAIHQLPPKQGQVFQMAYLDNKTHKEIAHEMQISENTVKKQMSLALKTLRDYLKKRG